MLGTRRSLAASVAIRTGPWTAGGGVLSPKSERDQSRVGKARGRTQGLMHARQVLAAQQVRGSTFDRYKAGKKRTAFHLQQDLVGFLRLAGSVCRKRRKLLCQNFLTPFQYFIEINLNVPYISKSKLLFIQLKHRDESITKRVFPQT